MAISIKNPEADQLARALANATGLSLTDTILKSLREQLLRETARSRPSDLTAELMEIGDRCSALPDLDLRTPEEIIGFEEFGIPV